MQKITPFLWFDNQAEEAANYYVSIFGNSRILKIVRYGGWLVALGLSAGLLVSSAPAMIAAVMLVGLGSVGSDLGARLVRVGVRVIGCDPDRLIVEKVSGM